MVILKALLSGIVGTLFLVGQLLILLIGRSVVDPDPMLLGHDRV